MLCADTHTRHAAAACCCCQVMMATGRSPKVGGLGLEEVGVQLGEWQVLLAGQAAAAAAAATLFRCCACQ
jgi:pyruvate/2-oxoglutarate dehydrogenase complex dihydrolipoamide dehydrogenase (E3) component